MSQCKCGKEGCDGTVCMCGTSCGCESIVDDFQEILIKKRVMPSIIATDIKGVCGMHIGNFDYIEMQKNTNDIIITNKEDE